MTKPKDATPVIVPPQLPAVIHPHDAHPHQNLDRAARAGMARLTGGVSPHAFISAWHDWALHLLRSPGRMLELAERAQTNALHLSGIATNGETAPPFPPKSYDRRFDHPNWQNVPFFGSCIKGFWPFRTGGILPPTPCAVCGKKMPTARVL
jgi:polyhydroxyalkanoate synthase